jgi:protein-disulfide isomerase
MQREAHAHAGAKPDLNTGGRAMADGKRIMQKLLVACALVLVGVVTACLVLAPGPSRAGDAPGIAADMPQDEFERRVRAYLLANPEVVVEAVQRLEARQRAAEQDEAQANLKARSDEVFRDPASPVGGNPQGDVTLVEFFDYNCPFCRRMAPVMGEAEAADPKLRVVYKEFPILGPDSRFAAKAALAAHKQGKYVAFHKALMQAKGVTDERKVLAVAAEVGRLTSSASRSTWKTRVSRRPSTGTSRLLRRFASRAPRGS